MKGTVRWGATFASAVLFAIFIYLTLTGADRDRYLATAVLLVFMVLATRLDDIKDLTLGPTGLATKLEKQLQDAQATVKQLQDFAEVFAARSVQQIAGDNRMSGLSPADKREAIEEIIRGLRAIELPEDRVKAVIARGDPYDDFDYWSWVTQAIYFSDNERIVNAINEFYDIRTSKGIGDNPSAEATEAFLRSAELYFGEIAERMMDWRYWSKHRKHRRLARWEARHGRDDPTILLGDAVNST